MATSLGGAAIAVHADVASASDIKRLIATAEDRYGRVDILRNNAS